MNLNKLGLQIDSPLAYPTAKNFRPPIWPPPPDWSPIVDETGIGQCVYSDSVWPLDVWAGKPLKINFGDGKTKGARIDKANANLLRICTAWFIWGTRGCRNAGTLASKFSTIKPLFVACTQAKILATDLARFPPVLERFAQSLHTSKFAYAITILHDLLDAKDDIGYSLVDKDGLARLSTLAPKHEIMQTPYIPLRIWSHQLSRSRECLIDYTKHQAQIEACFEFCVDAYAHNFGTLKQAVNSNSKPERSPFQNRKSPRKGYKYHGSFQMTAERFGVALLITQWVGPFTEEKGRNQINMISRYLDLVSRAGMAYLVSFSLMRIEEAWNLRSNCLLIERDERFGEIYMLRGETTKTDPDADARWPVSESASLAITAMKRIAALRMRCAKERDGVGITPEDLANPYLISHQYEPWSHGKRHSYRIRPVIWTYKHVLDYFPRFLDPSKIIPTEKDLELARLITPSLNEGVFRAGIPWCFGWHQLRRTGAVNMLSSDTVDESSLQFLLKHHSRVMTLYYGRNHSRLQLSEETRTMFVKTMYQELGRQLQSLQSSKFISPLGPTRKAAIVTFINEADALSLEKAARQGKVGARRIRAGFCVNHRACPYGGVEAIAHCLGGEGGKGCPDILVDTTREPEINTYQSLIDEQLINVHPESPRHRSLQAEKRAIARYYEIIQTQDR